MKQFGYIYQCNNCSKYVASLIIVKDLERGRLYEKIDQKKKQVLKKCMYCGNLGINFTDINKSVRELEDTHKFLDKYNRS